MKVEYAEWIAAHPGGYGLCSWRSAQMRDAFPELTVTFGFANGREHVWLVTGDGEVVDPTVEQFGTPAKLSIKPVDYQPFKPGDTVRVGKCRECGFAIFAEVEDLNDPKYARSICDECKVEGADETYGPF